MELPVLISPKELSELQASQKIVILDTRDPDDFAKEHIPGAVNVRKLFTYLVEDSTPETLTKLQTDFAEILGAAGLSGSEPAVIYEEALNKGYGQSCRGYFILKYLGYPQVGVLHGGYMAWKQAGLPVTAETTTPEPKTFPMNVSDAILLTKEDMLKAIADPGIVKLDVRDFDEWQGDSSSPYGVDFCPRKGRIPGAVWIEWYRMMEPGAEIPTFKSTDEILKVCDEVGISPDMPVYVYCFKGSRAANTLIALKQAGFKDVRNYFSSWNEWSRDPELPIEEGAPDPQKMAAKV
ncbi:Rhodanese-like protein [Thalassoporum mexicanum PCC 7367]|uniref:sulfurtransferase n=1 Tax=Thalassoporum mexicanum TaxID=3457544 RepID=UPI00029FE794|nr:sulfurtransferase [Pseudanabaena sp. PCC 7367]AFY71820.1 Rhodanese-like protein [Pseudanabaena sp. PCC 7367]